MANELNDIFNSALESTKTPEEAYQAVTDKLATKGEEAPPAPAPAEKEPVNDAVESVIENEAELPQGEESEQAENEQSEVDPRDALFADLRQRFPNETFAQIGQRVESALGNPAEAAEQTDGSQGDDPLDYIGQEFNDRLATLKAAQDAQEALEKEAEENGTVLEFNRSTREVFEAVSQARIEAQSAYKDLQSEALNQVAQEFPEMSDQTPDDSLAKVLWQEMVAAASRANPNFDAQDPTLVARMAREAVVRARSITSAAPQPQKPAPARKPSTAPRAPVAALPASVQGNHARVGATANGPNVAPNLADMVRTHKGSLNDLADMVFGGGGTGWISSK